MTKVYNIGIYKIINTITGDFYIGQSIHLDHRKQNHFYDLRTGKHKNIHFQRAFNKYGEENFKFEVILYCEPFELTRYEQALVDKWKPKYNILTECVDSSKGYKHTEEDKKKMSETHMGELSNNYGKHFSEEHRNKISKALTGIHRTEEFKKNISKIQKGRRSPKRGTKLAEETKQKISAALLGRKQTLETIQKRIESRKKNKERKIGQEISKYSNNT